MARKDQIFQSFLTHPLLKEKYEINGPLPEFVRDGLLSDVPIIRSIALIVDSIEVQNPVTDGTLRTMINQYLNTAAQ